MATTASGSDIFLGADGLSMQFPRISSPAMVVGLNLFRRCTTDPKLPAFRGNSIDIVAMASGGKLTLSVLPSLEKDIIRCAIFDERIAAVFPKVTLDLRAEAIKIYIRGTLVTGQDFSLTIDMVSAKVVNVAVA